MGSQAIARKYAADGARILAMTQVSLQLRHEIKTDIGIVRYDSVGQGKCWGPYHFHVADPLAAR